MPRVTVNDNFFKQMANTLRDKFHQWVDVVIGQEVKPLENGGVWVSKTPNAISFTERNGGYGDSKEYKEVITIPGAVKIVVDMGYQSESTSYDWVQVAAGTTAGGTKYGNSGLQRTTLTFENTDTVNFYFRSDGSSSDYLGYYAEVRGYDENGEQITTEITYEYETRPTEKYATAEMLEAVKDLYPASVLVDGAVVYVVPPVAIEGSPIDIGNPASVLVDGAVVVKYPTVNITAQDVSVSTNPVEVSSGVYCPVTLPAGYEEGATYYSYENNVYTVAEVTPETEGEYYLFVEGDPSIKWHIIRRPYESELTENAVLVTEGGNVNIYFDFVSDYQPTVEELVGGKYGSITNGTSIELLHKINEVDSNANPCVNTIATDNGTVLLIGLDDGVTVESMGLWELNKYIFVIPADNTTITCNVTGSPTLTFPKAGLYFSVTVEHTPPEFGNLIHSSVTSLHLLPVRE